MEKKLVNSILLILLVWMLTFYYVSTGSLELRESIVNPMIITLICGFVVFDKLKLPVVFLIIYLFLFVLFCLDPGMVDWTSYLLVGILSLPLSILATYAVKGIRSDKQTTSTLVNSLHRKFPNMPLWGIYGINILILSLVVIGALKLITGTLKIVPLVILFIFIVLFSCSDIYFIQYSKQKTKQSLK